MGDKISLLYIKFAIRQVKNVLERSKFKETLASKITYDFDKE